eukprot:EG_transcript_59525
MAVFRPVDGALATFELPAAEDEPHAWACLGDPYNAMEGARQYLKGQLRRLHNQPVPSPQPWHDGGEVDMLLPVMAGTWHAAVLSSATSAWPGIDVCIDV